MVTNRQPTAQYGTGVSDEALPFIPKMVSRIPDGLTVFRLTVSLFCLIYAAVSYCSALYNAKKTRHVQCVCDLLEACVMLLTVLALKVVIG